MATSPTSQCDVGSFTLIMLTGCHLALLECISRLYLDLAPNLGFHNLRRDIDQSEGDQEGSQEIILEEAVESIGGI